MASTRVLKWLTAAILFMEMIHLTGCRKYGPVSQQASEYAQAVYNVCHRKDSARVELVEKQVRAAASAGDLKGFEEKYLLEILELARQEKWDEANANSRRLLEEQHK